ncbi:MAG: hypothetical protein OK422_03915 [Thaumarchaeota archaeon]|nr:hypothetical protein [Nitrososphaerota archaeon]
MISNKKYERHLRRCGTTHKHEPAELYVPSATPPWEGTKRGILVGPHSKRSRRKRLSFYAVLLVALVSAGGIFLIFLLLALL